MMKKISFLSILFLIFLATNGFAFYVNVTEGKLAHTFFNFDIDNDGVYDNDAGYDNTYAKAGNFNLEFKADPNSSTYYNTYGFCIDLTVLAGSGQANDSIITTDGLRKAGWVLDNFWGTGNTNFLNAGIQLAIWDFIYEPQIGNFDRFVPLNVESGVAAYSEYDRIMDEFHTQYPDPSKFDFDASNYRTIHFDDKQDMITTNPVPEPATIALFGLGLLGISLVGRKQR